MKTCLVALLLAVFTVHLSPIGAEEPKSSLSESQIKRLQEKNTKAAKKAWDRDAKGRSKEGLAGLEEHYQQINRNYREANIKDIIRGFLEKYSEGNRAGCATMYLAQKSGGEERVMLLNKCIEDFSDAYYLDGCLVGGLARLYLASTHQRSGKKKEASELIAEIEKDYKGAEDHSGNPIIDAVLALKTELENE